MRGFRIAGQIGILGKVESASSIRASVAIVATATGNEEMIVGGGAGLFFVIVIVFLPDFPGWRTGEDRTQRRQTDTQ